MLEKVAAEEVVAGRIYRLGGTIELDDRVSWAAPAPGRVQPVSCYVVFEGDTAYLVDTGIALHRALVVEQIRKLVPAGMTFKVVFTRAEYECVGNLGAVHHSRHIDEIIAGGMRNPFDAYDEVSQSVKTQARRQVLELGGTRITPLDNTSTLRIIPPMIRILPTYWIYDTQSRTLFSSDFFSHVTAREDSSTAILDSLSEDETTYETALAQVLKKFFWLPMAHTQVLRNWLQEIFQECEVENLAPTHGCVLRGKDVVDRHFQMMMELLERVEHKSQ